MEVMAFCIRLIIDVQVVLTAIAQHSYCSEKEDAAFPHIVPKRLQFFEYESIHLSCKTDISTDITVLRTVKEIDISRNASNWMTSRGSGTVNPAFAADSGAYWCEDKEGHKSNTINISVTAGMVILESPVPPTNKGENVTLYCKKKNTTGLVADFYKNGLLFKIGYKGFITIKNVSTSDEGLYKCHISGVGESSESWLTVMEPYESGHQPLNHHSNPQTLLWRVITFSLVSLLLLALGVIYYRKHTSADIQTEVTTSRGHNCSLDPQIATYAVVKKVTGSIAEPQNVTCTKVKKQRKEEDLIYEVVKIKENKEQDSNLHARPSLQEETVVYSSIKYVADY